MLPRAIVSELNRNLPYLINLYGGYDMFISYIRSKFDISPFLPSNSIANKKFQEVVNYFYTILSFKNNLFIISPWDYVLDLKVLNEGLGTVLPTSINIDKPYEIYDLDHNLLYSKTNHNGYFGLSTLDKDLINRSLNTDAYFLKYITYTGEVNIKLILINLHTNKIIPANEIARTVNNLNQESYLTLYNESSSSVNAYVLEDRPQKEAPVNTILSVGTLYNITPNNVVDLRLITGQWILIDHPTTEQTRITYPTNNLVMPISSNNSSLQIYYVGVNIQVEELNRVFNQSFKWSNKSLSNVISIID